MSSRPERAPSLERLLERLARRLRVHVLAHGLGRVALGAAGWACVAFLLDRWLHLPAGVRVLHTAILLALPAFLAWRELFLPLRRIPGRDGLALLVERTHPELSELLVSAVQLEARLASAPPDEAALVRRVLASAEQRAGELDLSGVDDPRGPRVSLGAGLGAALLAALLFGQAPAQTRIFLARMLGGGPEWPRRTNLVLEVPIAGGRAQVSESEGRIDVLLARGSDVPVVVRAEGVVPDEVTLHFGSGRREVLGAARGGVFRTLLRSVQEDLEFHVTGGDDRDRVPRVFVTVLQPPDVAALAVSIEPPAYTRLPARLVRDADVEVLAGSRVRVAMLPDPPDARGLARVLPEDRELPLVEVPWPRREEDDAPRPDEPLLALGFEVEAGETLRYRFELVDSSGLPNPDPGLFAIHVVADRPPEVEVLAPARGEIEAVAGGALPLRVRAFDDYGVARLEWSVESAGEAPRGPVALVGEPLEDQSPERGRRQGRFAARTLEVRELFGASEPVEGQLLELEVRAHDNREPQAQVGRAPAVRVRIVSSDELLRRVQDRLARARLGVQQLVELQRERRARTRELLASLEGDQLSEAAGPGEIGAVLIGQRRVQGDARSLARELAAVTETVLYARVDERAAPLLQELDRGSARITDRGFHPELWTALAARVPAGPGTGIAEKLVAAVGLAIDAAEHSAGRAVESLRAAQDATDLSGARRLLAAAEEEQAATLVRLEALLERLAEWDNFQSVLSLTRDILNRQRNLLERTKRFAKEN